MEKVTFSSEKMYTYIRGYATGKNMKETLSALSYARKMHDGQLRKGGEPYVIHPLTMACHALSIGICNDETVATILLHDVCEDCGVQPDQLPVNDNVKRAVELMTFSVMDGETKDIAKTRYYNLMLENPSAAITKILDRCHNVSSMAGAFSVEKLKSYIEETRDFVLPLLRKIKDTYPEYSNQLFSLKYHICSVVDAIDLTLKACEK